MTQRQLEFDERVADRIQSLLARCDAIRRGSDIDRPTRFDAAGERHAASVAAADVALETGDANELSLEGLRFWREQPVNMGQKDPSLSILPGPTNETDAIGKGNRRAAIYLPSGCIRGNACNND